MSEEIEKNKGGRPTKFKDSDLKLIRYMYRKGATDLEVCEELGIAEITIHRWKKAHPDFLKELKSWKEEADEEVERSLYERATGYSCPETKVFMHEGCIVTEEITKHYPPDPTSMIFWLKNRKKDEWRDKQEIDMSNKGEPIKVVLAYEKKKEAVE